ncbi:MAG: glycosyltransferase [Candidatus Koribacter versatilis]|uniref:Glycosyltransferase n=1 Tax=Candidatus Korobacter versatilis TaxID=658062 RepID=A0A932A9B4_9BACT|nr:glycosyltransferase [Candidatus Koribacter versatilis]
MKICVVTAFPPSRRGLNEYGFHIARELQRDPLLSVTVLADALDRDAPEDPDFSVERCWTFNALSNPTRLLQAVRECNPDVVWFNLLFSTFGDSPVAAFLGLTIPALVRMNGYYTHVTLHHLMDNIDLEDAGVRFPRLYRLAGSIATRMLLMANSVSVLLPAYRRTLMEKYRGENVHWRAHGILSARPEYPDFSRRGNPEHRIVAFGKWGTYKRLELLIEAFGIVAERMPNARLVVAGGDHPMTPGYVQSVAERWKDCATISFTGYVPEDKLPELFSTASVVVMPYTSATGSSGVAHLACEYGVPIVSADIADFREMAGDEGLAIRFYETGAPEGLAGSLLDLLNDPALQREMADQNFSAALRMTMPQIIRQYLRTFDLHQRSKVLEPMSRFRRLPGWVPSRSAIFRAAAPRWSAWM